MARSMKFDVWELRKSDYGFGHETHHVSYFTDKSKAEAFAKAWEIDHRYYPHWEYREKTIEIR